MNPIKLIQWGILLSILTPVPAFSETPQNARPYSKEATISHMGDMLRIDANSPRPLAQILDALRQKYGWVVDYEDPQYISSADLVLAPGSNSQSHIPAGGAFSVQFPATATDEDKILRLIVDSYNHSKNPGRFDVRRSPQGNFVVVGISAGDEKGAISPQQVPFDLPLSLPTEERSITDTVNLICQEIASQTHTAVILGVSPRSLLDRTAIKLGGTGIPSRELLRQSLMATHHDLYWRLLFDPDSKGYFLNIHSTGQ